MDTNIEEMKHLENLLEIQKFVYPTFTNDEAETWLEEIKRILGSEIRFTNDEDLDYIKCHYSGYQKKYLQILNEIYQKEISNEQNEIDEDLTEDIYDLFDLVNYDSGTDYYY